MNWIESTFTHVLDTSLAAALLIALAFVVIPSFRNRLPPWVSYGMWLLVFLRLAIPVVPQAAFSIWNFRKPEIIHAPAPLAFEQPARVQPALHQTETLPYQPRVPLIPILWLIGVASWFAVALVQHRRLATTIRRLPPCTDARVLSLLAKARTAFGVRKQMSVLINDHFEAPAVFGWRRPSLLLPEPWLKNATDQELYAALLHEIAHVKCRDALLNWACIFLRSIHWFNPLVWYAFRRLRAERELLCDALVMARLQPPDRALYGGMLLRLAVQLSGSNAPPTLMPILQHKPEIHRRIHMIAKYKSTPWLLSGAFTLLLIALASITFTRAAERKAPPASVAPPRPSTSLEVLRYEIDKQEQIVRKLQAKSTELALELGSTENAGSDILQKLALLQADAKTEAIRLSSLYDHLRGLNRSELPHAITTTSPDQQLSQLMQQRDLAEQKLADLLEDHTPDHPDVKRITRVTAQIAKQIDSRLEGVLNGMKTQLAAKTAHLKELNNALEAANLRNVERSRRQGPYQEVLQELRTEEEILRRLRLRLADERISNALERATAK